MKKLNSYFGMAENDYLYAKSGLEICRKLGNFNHVASGCSQAAEKYLKALAERCLVGDPDGVLIMKTHNLRTLVNKVKQYYPEIPLNSKDCKWLGDFYFDARYPGDNFVEVNEEDALECLKITEEIRTAVLAALDENDEIICDLLSNKTVSEAENREKAKLKGMKKL